MIWSSLAATLVLDVIIVGLVLTMIGISWSLGMFRKWRLPRTGRFLMIAGVSLTGLYYFGDLLFITVLPSLLESGTAISLWYDLQIEVRWAVSLISIALVSAGIIIEAYLRDRLEKNLRKAESQIVAAHDRIIESEMRFRSVVEQAPDSLYCFEFSPPVPVEMPAEDQIARSYDAVLVECNEPFAQSVSGRSAASTIGLRFGEMDSAHDTESHTAFFRSFIENGYRLVDYEQKYTDLQGKPRALRISISGIIRDGKLVRIWGAEKNIHEETRAKAALARRLRFQRLVTDISSQLLTANDDDAEQILRRCLEQVGTDVGANRASIAYFGERERSLHERLSWSRHADTAWTEFSQQDLPWSWARLLRGEMVEVTAMNGMRLVARRDAASLAKLGVQSLIALPLHSTGKTIGTCLFTNIRDRREWGTEDLDDLRVVANLFASKLAQIDARQELRGALSELQDARDRLEAENVYLREEFGSSHGFHELVGESEGLLECLRQVARVAATNTAVLLQGETGTGKELVARAIHERSARKNQPLVKVNCAALPANLIESELFGHEKGAFTGATARKLGRFDLADGGTLFLDEIADLPIELQSKLLRALQSGEFERLGGDQTLRVDVRVIAATNRDLIEAVECGQFRADLYYRINTFPITLPALRDRGEDVALLAEHFVRKHSAGLGKTVTEFSSEMMHELMQYPWPGNVRELEGVIQRALIYSTGPVLRLAKPLRGSAQRPAPGAEVVEFQTTDLRAMERSHIERVLEQSRWVVTGDSGAATKLGVPPSTLRSKMKKLGIVRPG